MWCEEVVRLDMNLGSSLEVLPPPTTGKSSFMCLRNGELFLHHSCRQRVLGSQSAALLAGQLARKGERKVSGAEIMF